MATPKEIRDKLDVKAGDRVAFRDDGEGRIVVEAENVDLLALLYWLRRSCFRLGFVSVIPVAGLRLMLCRAIPLR